MLCLMWFFSLKGLGLVVVFWLVVLVVDVYVFFETSY